MTEVSTEARANASKEAGDRYAVLDKALRRVRFSQDQLIEMLHVAQDVFGYLPEDVLWHLARQLRLPPSTVYGTATFYHLFSLEEPGDHMCTVCTGTVCYVNGADDILDAVSDTYDVPPGGTSADRRLTLRTARCLGSCSLAPIAVVDGDLEAHMDRDRLLRRIATALGEDADAVIPASHEDTGVVR